MGTNIADDMSLFPGAARLKVLDGVVHPLGKRRVPMVLAPGIREPQFDPHPEAPKVRPVPSLKFYSQPAAFPYCSTQGSSRSFVQRERACSHRSRPSGGLVRLM